MAVQDFLITFRADSAAALRTIDALARRVKVVDDQLNSAITRMAAATGRANPIAGIAQGGAGAARAAATVATQVNAVATAAKGASKSTEELLGRLKALETGFSTRTAAGRGFAVNQGRVNEAFDIIQRLRDAHVLSAREANQWADRIQASFAKAANIPQSMRALPVELQSQFSRLTSQRAQNAIRIENLRQPIGGQTNIRQLSTALESQVRLLQRMEQISQGGINTARERNTLERELVRIRAQAALQGQNSSLNRSTETLVQTAARQRAVAQGATFDNPTQQRNAFRTLEKTLIELQRRGEPVQRALDGVRTRIEALGNAAARARGLDTLGRRLEALEFRLERMRQSTGGIGTGGNAENTLVRSIMRNLEAQSQIGSPAAVNRLNNYRAQFAALPPSIDRATQSMLNFVRQSQERIRMQEIVAPGSHASPALLGNALGQSLQLSRQGLQEGGEAAAFFEERINRLPRSFSEATRGLVTHSRRIAEGILLYDAFGRAMQGVASQIDLIGTLTRETIRFEQVAGDLSNIQQADFFEQLRGVATRTNTPLDQLVSQMDTIAFAFNDAGSAVQTYTSSVEFMDTVGKFTNITQRDLASETQNLLGIMNVTGDSLGSFENRLGRIAVAGGRSSVGITAIIDILSEAGRAAQDVGFDFDLLTTIGAEMFRKLQGSMTGTELGTQFRTIFGKLGDPSVLADLEELTEGVIAFRDEAGNIRGNALIELFQAIESGALDANQARKALDLIVPPLNPGARAFVTTFQQVLPTAIENVVKAASGSSRTIDDLNDALVSGPAERFSRAIIDIQGALANMFEGPVLLGFNVLANALGTIADLADNEVTGSLIGITAGLLGAVAGARLFGFAWRTVTSFLLGGRQRAAEIAAQIAAAGGAAGSAAGQMTLFGTNTGRMGKTLDGGIGKLRQFATGIGALARTLKTPLIVFLAFEIVGNAGDAIQEGIDSITGRWEDAVASTKLPDGLLERALKVSGDPDLLGVTSGISESLNVFGHNLGETIAGAFGGGGGKISAEQFRNIVNVVEVMRTLDEQGKLNAATQAILEGAITDANGAILNQAVSVEEITAAYQEGVLDVEAFALRQQYAALAAARGGDAATDAANATRVLSYEQQVAAGAATNLASLQGSIASTYADLANQLREGAITQAEYSQGTEMVTQAADLAARVVAAEAEQLARLPQFAAAAAQGHEALSQAVYDWIIQSGNALPMIQSGIQHLLGLSSAIAHAAETARLNPIVITMATRMIPAEETSANPELLKAQRGAQSLAASRGVDVAGLMRQLREGFTGLFNNPAILGAGNRFTGVSGTGTPSSAGGGGAAAAKQPQQSSIVDIGDLPASAVAKIVALATTAQNRVIRAGGVVDRDDVTALLKDAQFQKLIRGIDQRFLQEAIEELTDVEKARLEEERRKSQANELLRNLNVRAGPLGALISQPTLFGVGGSIPAGLNADPTRGDFTVNVPVSLSGLSPESLQQIIYQIVSKAIRDGLRLSGNI